MVEFSAYDYRFHELPSDDAAVSLRNQLISLRDLARSAPLEHGTQFTLDLQIPPQNQHPAARQVPSTLTTDRFQSATVTLQLDKALQSGCDKFSQVWTATVIGVPETRLVVKIIQPSLCFIPEPDNIHWCEAYYDPLDLAHNEAWVYQKLAHRQGLSIPYFFGIFDIVTPSGEAAWVLVLEFIQGPTIHGVAKLSKNNKDMVHDFCNLGLDAVRELALSGWTLRDMSCSNFILSSSSGSKAVVMIDLYDAVYVKPPPTLKRLAMVDANRFFYWFQLCVRDEYPGFYDWAMQNLPVVVWGPPDFKEDM
ncbi:hypothetical protein GGX14DRAFT_605197 [Mycena pura]|uniref:Uncharacterized protein n=1 Tax=Mycena pura TaxID=153505 RepID=A0AAD6VLI4_9AGAR|nr:hypothetical protein GGX14DRAFT_605197 [Mycena pura]